jgi:hypothetical protein
MILVLTSDQPEVSPEFRMKPFRGVADHRKSAAVIRTVLGKGRDENVAAGPHRAANLVDICLAINWIGEEVKNRAVVPDCVCALVELGSQNVRAHPLYPG